MKIRGQEVLLPTTMVGSYPRPLFMQGRVFTPGSAEPEFPSFRVRELYRDAVALVVKDQTDAGLDIVTDGGQHYEGETDYELAELFHTMPHHLEGYLPYGERLAIGNYDMPIWRPTAVGPITWRRPIFKPVVEAVKAATDGPAKVNVCVGPVTLALLTTDKHYGGDLKALSMDIATAYNAELKDLAARGLDQVQFAEPLALLFHAIEPEGWVMDAINKALEGVAMHRVVHMCYGHEEGQSMFGPGFTGQQKVFPWAFDIDCDQIHLETVSTDFGEIAHLKGWPADKVLGVGVIDVKNLHAEDPQTVAGKLRQILEVVPPEQVCVSTDCSIASVRRVVAKKKLAAMVEGTRIVRDELTGQ